MSRPFRLEHLLYSVNASNQSSSFTSPEKGSSPAGDAHVAGERSRSLASYARSGRRPSKSIRSMPSSPNLPTARGSPGISGGGSLAGFGVGSVTGWGGSNVGSPAGSCIGLLGGSRSGGDIGSWSDFVGVPGLDDMRIFSSLKFGRHAGRFYARTAGPAFAPTRYVTS
jgi:hypothetical protein